MRSSMTLALTGILTLASIPGAGAAGKESSGGGDAHVIEFLTMSEKICNWSRAQKDGIELDADQCFFIVKNLKDSLNEQGPAKLTFTDSKLKDGNGISKAAIFDSKAGTIQVNRSMWKDFSKPQKYALAATEIAGLSGHDERYNVGEVVSQNADSIDSAPLLFSKKASSLVQVKLDSQDIQDVSMSYVDTPIPHCGPVEYGSCNRRFYKLELILSDGIRLKTDHVADETSTFSPRWSLANDLLDVKMGRVFNERIVKSETCDTSRRCTREYDTVRVRYQAVVTYFIDSLKIIKTDFEKILISTP